ncbi:PepSY-associated TM helix domain-containing protein [Sandaracinobacteroides saxicola]|uniref:PepSY domain-containing protein n=1 Tax=Sandaracinobacteroides saxicola TaxID=2759707 RepID=A0A7G5IHZ8_9SPHN|nr:PepSY-associated TM helix domain-containing protein [Sandaracinobacteroides saxicola]QMW22990.1 PepSY domain-containing protein [Sandaracinobacteroides saxicola]
MRRSAISLHLWLGLILGFFWALQGLTGSILVLHREADRLVNPALASGATGPWLPLESLVAAAGVKAERITIVDSARNSLAIHHGKADSRRAVIVEAATGTILGDRAVTAPQPDREGIFRWLFLLHHELLAGDLGETILGISALFLFSSLLLGLWIATPWRGLFRISAWRTSRIRLWGWHRMVGVLAALALLPLSLTGAYLIWGKELRAAAATVWPMQLPPEGKSTLAGPAIGLDRAWAIANGQFPDATFVSATLPGPKAAAYKFRLHQPGEARALFGVTAVWVDGASGTISYRYDPLDAAAANRVIDSLFAIHSGEIAGWPGRLAVLAAGLSLPMLWITGLWAWLRAQKRRNRPIPA